MQWVWEACRSVGRACDRAATVGLIALVVLYKLTLSPLLGRHCRFQPTCSSYFRQSVEKYGAFAAVCVASAASAAVIPGSLAATTRRECAG